jgi:hypothetical protein
MAPIAPTFTGAVVVAVVGWGVVAAGVDVEVPVGLVVVAVSAAAVVVAAVVEVVASVAVVR